MGFAEAKAAQWALGDQVRALLGRKNVPSVAAEGYQAPGVVVSYTEDGDVQEWREVPRPRAADRGGRAAATGRGGGIPHLPAGGFSVWTS